VLVDMLNFLPSDKGGLFQFPLDRVSPRITRGIDSNFKIPYITPSLMDLPWGIIPENSNTTVRPPGTSVLKCATNSDQIRVGYTIFAPWRSLIYRNVDTPFTYSDDYALFPHMPMNTPGFDCRAPRILGDWMVSIPAALKNPDLDEYAFRAQAEPQAYPENAKVIEDEQPYVEVKQGDPKYAEALDAAKGRLKRYHEGDPFYLSDTTYNRYTFCPDTSDIVDPESVRDPASHPVPTDEAIYEGNPPKIEMPSEGVPNRAHWVVTDLTEPLGDWGPRRSDWSDVLVHGPASGDAGAPPGGGSDPTATAVELLQSVNLTEAIRSFASKEVPFGLWVNKSGCNFSSVPSVGTIPQEQRPAWMNERMPPVSPTDPVYMLLPGAAVFNMICINCHGPQADSQGRQADILMTITGGETRVANLRHGLFGPEQMPGANRARVFKDAATDDVSTDDWGARYLAWMGLGGTQRTIPGSILAIVGNTDVLGEHRTRTEPPKNANMLSTAQELCGATIMSGIAKPVSFDPVTGHFSDYRSPPLIWKNGDGELWKRLCSIDHKPPVRAIQKDWTKDMGFDVRPYSGLYDASTYPADAPVGDDQGRVVTGIGPDNLTPWCIRKPLSPQQRATAEQFVADPQHFLNGKPMPFCPESVIPAVDTSSFPPPGFLTDDQKKTWAMRGAINAGLAVFIYLDKVTREKYNPKPRYDQCEQLQR
jgi:hypothetical protein